MIGRLGGGCYAKGTVYTNDLNGSSPSNSNFGKE